MADYFSSMFRRRPNDGWFRAGRYDVTTTDLVCGLAVISMLIYGVLGANDWARLPFWSRLVREDLEVWRLISWPIATRPGGWEMLSVLFFWLFGQQLEALFGRQRFLGWIAAVAVIPAVLVTALGAISSEIDGTNAAFGLSLIFTGGIWVLAATFPRAKWFDVVPLWAVAAIFTALDLLQYNGNGLTGQVIFIVLTVATALFAGRSLGQATGWPIPHIPLGDRRRRPAARRAARPAPNRRSAAPNRGASTGSVVEGPWSAPPPPVRKPADVRAAQDELDQLLDKISSSGLESLTADEKRRLNELSKQLRD